jgi:hypothetical protein
MDYLLVRYLVWLRNRFFEGYVEKAARVDYLDGPPKERNHPSPAFVPIDYPCVFASHEDWWIRRHARRRVRENASRGLALSLTSCKPPLNGCESECILCFGESKKQSEGEASNYRRIRDDGTQEAEVGTAVVTLIRESKWRRKNVSRNESRTLPTRRMSTKASRLSLLEHLKKEFANDDSNEE